MVEGMYVVVNVMLSLMSVINPPPALGNLSARTVVKSCTVGGVGFLNCDDICTCVANKQFMLLEFVFDSFYVDLQYDEISLTFTAGVCVLVLSLSCDRLWSVCEIVVVPYVDAAVAVTVMHVLLFVLHACLLRESDGARLTAMLVWGMDEVWLW